MSGRGNLDWAEAQQAVAEQPEPVQAELGRAAMQVVMVKRSVVLGAGPSEPSSVVAESQDQHPYGRGREAVLWN